MSPQFHYCPLSFRHRVHKIGWGYERRFLCGAPDFQNLPIAYGPASIVANSLVSKSPVLTAAVQDFFGL